MHLLHTNTVTVPQLPTSIHPIHWTDMMNYFLFPHCLLVSSVTNLTLHTTFSVCYSETKKIAGSATSSSLHLQINRICSHLKTKPELLQLVYSMRMNTFQRQRLPQDRSVTSLSFHQIQLEQQLYSVHTKSLLPGKRKELTLTLGSQVEADSSCSLSMGLIPRCLPGVPETSLTWHTISWVVSLMHYQTILLNNQYLLMVLPRNIVM